MGHRSDELEPLAHRSRWTLGEGVALVIQSPG
jgi:hypothetical protein